MALLKWCFPRVLLTSCNRANGLKWYNLDVLNNTGLTAVVRSAYGDTDILVLVIAKVAADIERVLYDGCNGSNLKAGSLNDLQLKNDFKEA